MATKKNATKIVRSNGKPILLPWPEGYRPTKIRKRWHARLCECPGGLSLQALSERLDEPYASVAFWAKRMAYPFILLKRGRKSDIPLDR